jgi:hypothetical protein
MKINKSSVSARASYVKLSSQVFLKLANHQSIRELLADFIANTSDRDFDEKFIKLLKNPKIRSVISVFSKDIDNFSKYPFRAAAPMYRILKMYAYFIDINKDALARFVIYRDRIEHLIMVGNYAAAKVELNILEADLGESIWFVRTNMLILSSLGDNESLKSFCDTTQASGEGSFNSFIFKASQLIIDSGNATSQLAAIVHRQIAEFKEAKHNVLVSFLQVLFNPFPVEKEVDHISCIEYLQTYPIVDLYSIILHVLKIEFSDYQKNSSFSQDLRNFGREISKIITDPILNKVTQIEKIVSSGPMQLTGNALCVFEKYKSGDYSGALANYSVCLNRDDSAVSLANLAGKSLAYLGDQSVVTERGSVLEILAKDLSTIYSLSPLWSQAEDQITSACIKHNHLTISSCLQLALLKSLPFRYSQKQQRLAARLAIVSTNFATPQTFALATETNSIMNYISLSANVPEHRRVKEQLIGLLSADKINIEMAEGLLAKLQDVGALHKEILECYVAFYLKIGNDAKLLQLAASEIILDSNRHISLPMETLIDLIEREQLADLDAVILCYHYNLSISDEKDSLLNETFEEYLISTGVSRPSQLLAEFKALDLRQQFFFREICIPDIMDYLGCFTGSNGLRSERIIILDQLQEIGVVDPKDRMREVEELVRQVIVDTGTSEFNSAKVFVNEAIIRRKHLDEIASLITIYKKAPLDSEDRYTQNDHDPSTGVYLSGSRNSTVLKMFGIIAASYLFDDKYGLDKNLSGEIRHGFFSNLMRARLEEHNLLTELDDRGEYLPNDYWQDRNPLIKQKYWYEIDDVLKDFSRCFDKQITEAEEWMKINLQTINKARLFTFKPTLDEIDHIKDILNVSEDASYIIDYVITILSEKTDAALSSVRERLNGELKTNLIDIFHTTIDKLNIARGGAALLDLMNAMVRVSNEIHEDIHTATLWFYKSENPEISAGTLDRLVEIAVRSFEKVRGNAYVINLSIPPEFSTVPVNSRIGKPFILAIINLLDNCYVHSGLQQSTQVSISGDLIGTKANLKIANNLSEEKQEILSEYEIEDIRLKLCQADVSMHIRGEGGTGLIKACHEITYLGLNSNLSISRLDDKFIANIAYDFEEV